MRSRFAILALFAMTLPARAGDFSERSLSMEASPGHLSGTLTTPSQAVQTPLAILFITGSGPTDRDGNTAQGVRASTYRLLAAGLAAHGIASLRVDKRGVGESKSAFISEADITISVYADDAKAWAKDLRAQTGASCVWLLGYNEGALIAEYAAQTAPDICGLILIGGSGRRAGDLLRRQLGDQLSAPLRQTALAAIAALEAGQTVADPPPELPQFRSSMQPYLISWTALDPMALLAKLKIPTLILQGDNDLLVPVDDARILAAAQPNAMLVILPGVNHVLKIAPSERTENLATYAETDIPLAPTILNAMVDFVRAH